MNIYFAGSIKGGRDDRAIYSEIIQELKTYGTVLTEHVGFDSITDKGETQISQEEVFIRDLEMLNKADVIVAEVTQKSLGVGYEIGRAEAMDKPILALYRGQKSELSAMIAGNGSISLSCYKSVDEIAAILDQYLLKDLPLWTSRSKDR